MSGQSAAEIRAREESKAAEAERDIREVQESIDRELAGKAQAAGEAAEPAQSTAAEQQTEDGFFAEMLERPQQFRTDEPAEDAGNRGIHAVVRQPRAPQLTAEEPDAGQRSERHEYAEARDLEIADSEDDWKHLDPIEKGRVLYAAPFYSSTLRRRVCDVRARAACFRGLRRTGSGSSSASSCTCSSSDS